MLEEPRVEDSEDDVHGREDEERDDGHLRLLVEDWRNKIAVWGHCFLPP